jgi:hypothetical protein
LFEEIELLEGLQSVDSEDKSVVRSHTETVHELLELDIVEDEGRDVVGVLLSHHLVGLGLNLGGDTISVSEDSGGDLVAECSGVVVSLLLRVRNTEGEVLGDLVEVVFDGGHEFSLWVLLNLGSLSSSRLVSSNILIRDGVGSNIWEGRNVLNGVWVVVVSGDCGSRGDESAISQEFHYLF